VLLVFAIWLVKIIPTNRAIKDLGEKLNPANNPEKEESLISGGKSE